MNQHYFVVQLSLCCFLFFSCQPAPQPPTSGPFPVEGEVVSAEEAKSLVFRWEDPQTSSRVKQPTEQETLNPDQILRIYQFESREQQETRTVFHFKLMEEAAVNGNTFIFSNLQTFLPFDQVYAWEVFSIDSNNGEKIPLQELTHFSIGSPTFDDPEDELALQSFFADTQNGIECIWRPNQCEDLTCWLVGPTSGNTHIATFHGFGSDNHSSFSFSTNSGGTLPNEGGPCLKVANDKINLNGNFSVKVPHSEINSVYPTTVEVYLFKGEERLTGNDFTWQFKLNGGLPETEVTLNSNDYLSYCDGFIGEQLIGRAQVELFADFSYEADQSYTLVFYIPTDQPHTHGSVTVNTQPGSRNAVPETNHTHDNLRLRGCQTDYLENTLGYFDCMDRSNDHPALHVVLIKLTDYFCPEENVDQ